MVKQLHVALLLTIASILMECKFPLLRRKTWNIRKFADTSEYIWTYTTSDTENIRCKVDVKQFATPSSLFFNRWYKLGTEKTYKGFKAVFDKKHKECMTLHMRGYIESECTVYHDKRSGCAVIRVKTENAQTTYYDLRVQDSFIVEGPSSKCFRMFAKQAVQGHVIYDAQCKEIFAHNAKSSVSMR
nr:uncharacterized protein LOC129385508 [Dermacentor andersoni]